MRRRRPSTSRMWHRGTANIHAGVKMLRNIDDTYFNDPKIDRLNKTLFVFASYNAGPNRIARLRKAGPRLGLDPMSGSVTWNWLRPRTLGRRPSPTSPISTSITSRTSWRWSKRKFVRRPQVCRPNDAPAGGQFGSNPDYQKRPEQPQILRLRCAGLGMTTGDERALKAQLNRRQSRRWKNQVAGCLPLFGSLAPRRPVAW